MARFYCLTLFLILSSPALMQFSNSTLSKVVPQTQKPTGVFMLIDGGKYTLNFSDARAACLFLNVTMATRHQMERAVQHGLETCKFGWLAEQIAVIPRVKPEKNCGSGKIGAVTWSASPEKQFGVFCFNDSALSDQDETVKTSAAGPPSSPATSSQAALTRSSSSLTPLVTSTRSPPSTEATTQPKETSLDFTLLMETTTTSSPSSPSPKTDPPPHFMTSKTADVSLEFLTSPQAAKPSLGAGPTALLSVGLVLLLLIAAGVGWYCRPRPFGWRGRLLNDDTETEMWKKTDSYCEPEDEVDKTYSSNITLCVDPCFKANSGSADLSVEV